MNIDFSSIVFQPDGSWLFQWTDTSWPAYRIVLFGMELKNSITNNQFVYSLGTPAYPNFPPPIELVGMGQLAVSELHQPIVVLQWYNDAQPSVFTDHYQGQQYDPVNHIWFNGPSVSETGLWVYTFNTPVLADDTSYNFRIVAIGIYGQESCGLPFQINMVCCPILDDDTYSIGYDNTAHAITFTEES